MSLMFWIFMLACGGVIFFTIDSNAKIAKDITYLKTKVESIADTQNTMLQNMKSKIAKSPKALKDTNLKE